MLRIRRIMPQRKSRSTDEQNKGVRRKSRGKAGRRIPAATDHSSLTGDLAHRSQEKMRHATRMKIDRTGKIAISQPAVSARHRTRRRENFAKHK